MSEENVEIVRRCYRVMEKREWSAYPELFDPDVVFDVSRNVFNPDVYRGQPGLQQFAAVIDEIWSNLRLEPRELIDLGDRVVAAVKVHGKGKESGVDVNMELFSVWTLRESRVVRMEGGYRDRSEALEAAGLAEQDTQAES